MSRQDIRSARRLRKGERKGKEPRNVENQRSELYAHNFLFFILLFIYFSLSVILLSIPADSRRNPSPRPASVTGAFSPGAPTVLGSLKRSSLDLLQLSSRLTSHSRFLPSTAARISNGVTRCVSLIPHRLSSSPDWRPASLFVPAYQCLGKRAPAFSDNRLVLTPMS
jgi:hypothetical protein